jgi:hypothetical protein
VLEERESVNANQETEMNNKIEDRKRRGVGVWKKKGNLRGCRNRTIHLTQKHGKKRGRIL